MLKKRPALFFLTLAYAILLGHNIIPHHHHEHDEHLIEHHDTDDHHDDDTDTDGLDHLFAHFPHATDEFCFANSHNITNTFFKQQLSFVAMLPDNLSLDNFLIPPLLDKPPADQPIYISPNAHPSGWRAPPVTFI